MVKCDHSEKSPGNKFTNAPHCYIVCWLPLLLKSAFASPYE